MKSNDTSVRMLLSRSSCFRSMPESTIATSTGEVCTQHHALEARMFSIPYKSPYLGSLGRQTLDPCFGARTNGLLGAAVGSSLISKSGSKYFKEGTSDSASSISLVSFPSHLQRRNPPSS